MFGSSANACWDEKAIIYEARDMARAMIETGGSLVAELVNISGWPTVTVPQILPLMRRKSFITVSPL